MVQTLKSQLHASAHKLSADSLWPMPEHWARMPVQPLPVKPSTAYL